jgi:hypothetical protein
VETAGPGQARAQDAAAARLEEEEEGACGWDLCVSERKREGVETAEPVGPPSSPVQPVQLGFHFFFLFSFIHIPQNINVGDLFSNSMNQEQGNTKY